MLFIRYDGGTEGHHEAPYASQPAINRKRGLDRPPKKKFYLLLSPGACLLNFGDRTGTGVSRRLIRVCDRQSPRTPNIITPFSLHNWDPSPVKDQWGKVGGWVGSHCVNSGRPTPVSDALPQRGRDSNPGPENGHSSSRALYHSATVTTHLWRC